ncbi:hypothetical protein EHS25_002104 [Saitozyma podzolica]|uniref:Glyoxal oxidase N-terminal domain-containing protein n=1 Tax=Saitozyma podzolica TaxID=1890683 RepID=A0A427YEU9_9TREE|nr:hypothetical protein EHS25_002104 [Saitozyma podzolica]
MLPAALLALPVALAASGSLPPLERNLRHRDLARSATSRSPVSRRTLEPKAGSVPLGGFEVVGNSGVSAQMMFLGTADTVYILDKTENNSLTVTTSGVTHPAWGVSYDLNTNAVTPMEVTSNTFCAGGLSVGNGSWVVFGGNQPVTYQGVAVSDTTNNPSGANPYDDADGGAAIRLLTPCEDDSCGWQEGGSALTMSSKRWYPTIEGLADGSLVVLGGDTNGGYVSTYAQNNPTYEYWPKQASGSISMAFLNATVPVNLFPLTWLTSSGKLFMQAAYKTILYDMNTKTETALPDMPYAQRVYPASAAAVMLPLTPANNYTQTILFCGGSAANLAKSTDGGAGFNVTAVQADDSCVRINPDDASPQYTDDDSLPEPRSMGQLIYLPDGTMWLGNGVGMGTAGYGDDKYSVGQSYGQNPVYMPAIYNPNAPAGSRFSRTGLSASPHERMYHSTAILLADGSVLVSGSNPNKDVTTVQWGTSYVVEKWYPLWYSNTRPTPSAFPDSLSYGGAAWNLTYTPTNSSSNPGNTKVVVIRTGFSTHCMNFGQRYLELETSYSLDQASGQVTLYVSQMPPNANIFQPGPAMIFLVVDGVPSTGQLLTIGSGAIETQTMNAASVLPQSSVVVAPSSSNTTASASTVSGTALSAAKSAALAQRALPTFPSSILLCLMILLGAFVWA